MIIVVLVMIFMIGFSVHVLFKQADEIEKFTRTEKVTLPSQPEAQVPAAKEALTAKLEEFSKQVMDEKVPNAELKLTAQEINTAVASYPQVEQLHGSFWVKEITGGKMIVDICYRMNGRPRMAKQGESGYVNTDFRYLVGEMKVHPEISKGEVFLKVDELKVPGAAVPAGFMEHFSSLRIFESYTKDPKMGPTMQALTSCGIEEDTLVLRKKSGEIRPGIVSDDAFNTGGKTMVKVLGIGACLFLVFAGTIVFIGLRKKARETN
jgi:hypothetical protein